jgi:hypothetical protein
MLIAANVLEVKTPEEKELIIKETLSIQGNKSVNLYNIGQNVIAEKQKFNSNYLGLFESQYDKNNKELWHDHIIEMENFYINMCYIYDSEPLELVLNWRKSYNYL